MLSLASLRVGERGVVSHIAADAPQLQQKLLAMGLTPNCEVSIQRIAPLGDPLAVQVRGTLLSLRKTDAEKVLLQE